MGLKMTAMVEFMGTQGNFEALKPSVFALITKNGIVCCRESVIAIFACGGRRYPNMGLKMTAIVEFMGTEGNFEALKRFVFT